MPYKNIRIEDHVSELHINGWVTLYSGNARAQKPMKITGKVDRKRFDVTTNGNNTLGEIVKMIVGEVQ